MEESLRMNPCDLLMGIANPADWIYLQVDLVFVAVSASGPGEGPAPTMATTVS